MPGVQFEPFVYSLLSRRIYPALMPTSPSHDLGEDGYTAASRVFEHGGKQISLAASKTATLSKIQGDCMRARETGRAIDVLVFVTTTTPSGDDPNTATTDEWRQQIRQEFGWDLDVITLRALVPIASRPEYEDLADQYLRVPPLGEDPFQHVQAQFDFHSKNTLRVVNSHIPGIQDSLPRAETQVIEEQLALGRHVVISGAAGTGKSALGAQLITSVKNKTALFVDARRLGSITNEAQLRQHFDLRGSLRAAIKRAGRNTKCRVIIDQLDNVAGLPIAELLLDIIADSISSATGIDWIVVCRNETPNEHSLLSRLLAAGFVENISKPVSDHVVIDALIQIGVSDPTPDLVQLGRNLLNLGLIATIRQQLPSFHFATLVDEVELWDRYINVVAEREGQSGPLVVSEAIKMAREGLASSDGTFIIEYPHSSEMRRLESWGIIVRIDGRQYRFKHEKLQDFLYAWDATQRHASPRQILSQIMEYKTRNVFDWMDKIYLNHKSPMRKQFWEEILSVR